MQARPAGIFSGLTLNPLLWSNAEKTLVLIGIFLSANLPTLLILYWLDLNPQYIPPIMVLSDFLINFEAVSVALPLLSIPILLLMRKRDPDGLWFVYIIFTLAVIHDTFLIAWFGYATVPLTFLTMLVFPFAGYLFFDLGVAIISFVAFALTLGGFMAAEMYGLIPYAPGLRGFPVETGVLNPVWFAVTYTLGTFITFAMYTMSGLLINRWRVREAEVVRMSEMLKSLFGRYMSTEIMDELMESPDTSLGTGERRQITVMMTDLRGFSALSLRLRPEQVVSLLNNFIEPMVEICQKYKGTINDIIGDALLVTFGAPVKAGDHASLAIACAIEMQNAMEEVNARNVKLGLPWVEMGIGINTDDVVMGNIGTEKRAKFTVIGSGVNTANRIEAYTVGGQILISENTKRQAGDILRIDNRMEFTPKGSEEPMVIYEVGGIGLPYGLAIHSIERPYTGLMNSLSVRLSVLEGKKTKDRWEGASFSSLSLKGGVLECGASLDPYTDIKLNLDNVLDDLRHISFYAKVIGPHEQGSDETYDVRFTAVPPEINAFIQAAIMMQAPQGLKASRQDTRQDSRDAQEGGG